MTLQGKGFIINELLKCEDGEPGAILAVAQAAGLSHVVIKVADGERAFGEDDLGADPAARIIPALKQVGIKVWGWHSVVGNNPDGEAAIALGRSQALGLDGYVVCAGEEYSRPGRAEAARQFMQAIRSGLGIPIAFSSFRFPNFHPDLPWSTFLEFCDVHMPQVSWEQAHNAGEQLRESKRQCDALPNSRTFIPTGPVYNISGWNPRPEEIIEFLITAVSMGLPAVNFFDWENCRRDHPQLWTAIAEFGWPGFQRKNQATAASNLQALPSSPDEVLAHFLEALNSRQALQTSALYDQAAMRVCGEQIMSGADAIQKGYGSFFESLPDGPVEFLKQTDMGEDTHMLSWKAGPLSGETTLVLENGKIRLDYTFLYEPAGQAQPASFRPR
jgi:hypothetical protein